jgi:cytochrome c oxidase subunit 4
MVDTPELQTIAVANKATAASPISLKTMIAVLVLLLVLTGAAQRSVSIDLGGANVWFAIGVAALQAFLVVFYFMGLRRDRPFNAVVLIASLFILSLFIGLVVLDTKEYHSSLVPPTGVAPRP